MDYYLKLSFPDKKIPNLRFMLFGANTLMSTFVFFTKKVSNEKILKFDLESFENIFKFNKIIVIRYQCIYRGTQEQR